ncbi:hypothetical protein BDY19DRAFT_772297 [Irpex rosettiformis]|uniref:Uncharacterized protein n=1 Tax=Irpex rosettiformis TaxID=378272 RepID=A0ACB8U7Z1_9APHY|nr:hypothetical protein BDY19DRAFT_772297 [Irpex rosettiformis]
MSKVWWAMFEGVVDEEGDGGRGGGDGKRGRQRGRASWNGGKKKLYFSGSDRLALSKSNLPDSLQTPTSPAPSENPLRRPVAAPFQHFLLPLRSTFHNTKAPRNACTMQVPLLALSAFLLVFQLGLRSPVELHQSRTIARWRLAENGRRDRIHHLMDTCRLVGPLSPATLPGSSDQNLIAPSNLPNKVKNCKASEQTPST